MDILVRDEWYKYYKQCEENLETIKAIMLSVEFKAFYDEADEKLSNAWDNCMIPIFELTTPFSPEERKNIERIMDKKEKKDK